MANARVTRKLSANSQFGRDVAHILAREAAHKFADVARLAEQEADRIVAAEFVNDRSPDRRRTGRHLLGSFNAHVEWDGQGFPVSISLGSTAEGKKLGSLNYGSPAHSITGALVFPVAERLTAGATSTLKPKARRIQAAYGKGSKGAQYVRTSEVNHPGTKAKHFMERALESAVRKTYGQAVAARRIRH